MHKRLPFDPSIHHRESFRLRGYDYRRRGSYFVTIDAHEFVHRFGEVRPDASVALTREGEIVRDTWRSLPNRFPYVVLGEDIVMPNHLHGIIDIRSDGTSIEHRASLGTIVGSFKSLSDRAIRAENPNAGRIWHRNYYESVIRDAAAFDAIERYIRANPRRWLERPRRR
jgi:REP element-mobilizing transposase RayT